jgi:pyridinium-3,5-bisthiocarboxylic acid mononucleotide nickel chelatase
MIGRTETASGFGQDKPMTKIAFFDCFSGISGNMSLGALLDCGLPVEGFRAEIDKLGLRGYRLEIREMPKAGLRGLFVEIKVEETQPHRHLTDIEKIIGASPLAERVRERSLLVFRKLAQAEAKAHGEAVEKIHFHEVGAVDAILDVVGTAICLEMLGVDTIYSSAVHIGAGTVQTAHGLLPVPAPATVELLKGFPVYGRDADAELVTPTGAAILAALAETAREAPPMRIERVGYGAGSRDLPWANLLRVTLGEESADVPEAPALAPRGERVMVVEANIDDMNPQFYEHVSERLFAVGALDVFFTPIQMKRNRPATMLALMVDERKMDAALEILFSETTTIGVRMHPVERRKLDREEATVATAFGPVRVKIARLSGRVMNVAPEYRDCLRIAAEKNVPLKDVYQAAMAAAVPLKK